LNLVEAGVSDIMQMQMQMQMQIKLSFAGSEFQGIKGRYRVNYNCSVPTKKRKEKITMSEMRQLHRAFQATLFILSAIAVMTPAIRRHDRNVSGMAFTCSCLNGQR